MKCKNETCNNVTVGRSVYCSDRCKVAYNRNKRNTVTVTDAAVTPTVTLDQSGIKREGFHVQPGQGITRQEVDDMIDGVIDKLPNRTRTTGCKSAIPGDEDYVGVCEKIQGKWQAKDKTRYEQPYCTFNNKGCEPLECDSVGRNGCQGTNRYYSQCLVDEQTKPSTMTRRELYDAIHAYPHDQWVNSPEHKELMHRLTTRSIAELEEQGYFIPAWKRAG